MNSNNVSATSIALKRQAKLPSHLNSALFNVRYVPSVLCKTFEESEDEENESELVIDSPGSDSSFSSSSASSSAEEDAYIVEQDSTLTSDGEEDSLVPAVPTHIVVTNVDLPEDDVLRSITMSFSTIDSVYSWPSHTSFYNEYCPAAVLNALPVSEPANGLQLTVPPKSGRGRVDKNVRSYWDGRKRKVVIKLPTVVVTEPNGNRRGALFAEETLSDKDLAEADEEIKNLLEAASKAKRTVTAGMFQSKPRPAPVPGQGTSSTIKTYSLQRRPSFRGLPISRRPAVKQVSQPQGEAFTEPPKQKQTPVIEATEQASPRVRFAPLPSREEASKKDTPSFAFDTCPAAPLRSILIKSQKPALRSILSNGKTPGRALLLRKRNVSFACKDSVRKFERWNFAEHDDDEQDSDCSSSSGPTTLRSSLSTGARQQSTNSTRSVSFAEEVQIREFERWNYAEEEEGKSVEELCDDDEVVENDQGPYLRSILSTSVTKRRNLLLHPRKVSFACEDHVGEVERWIVAEAQQGQIRKSTNSWDDVDDTLTLESTLAFLSSQAEWP